MVEYPRLSQRMNTLRILWAALLFSTVMFLVVLAEARPPPPPNPPTYLLFPFLAFAACSATIGVVFPMTSLKNAAARMRVQVMEEPTDDSLGYREPTSTKRVFVDPEGDAIRFLGAYQVSMILGLALAESVALLGFVLAFLGLPVLDAIPFFVVCWILQLSKFPTVSKVFAPLLRASGASLPTRVGEAR